MDFIKMCFSKNFMPHGHCYFWQPEILWPHVIGDAATAISYFLIPFLLLRFARKRPDVKEHYWFFYAFAAFILCCGVTHLLAIVSVWQPYYRLEAVAKVTTALVSVGTVSVLFVKFPLLLSIPSGQEMRKTQIQLQQSLKKEQDTAQRLRESEQQFRDTMQQAAIGMALISPVGKLIDVNDSFVQMLGYTRKEMLQLSFESFIHPDDLLAGIEYYKQLQRGEFSSYSLEKRYRHKQGHYVWGQLNVSMLRHEDGTPIYTIGQVQDITAAKQQEARIIELNQSLETKVEQRTAELTELHREMQEYTYTITHDLRQPLRNLSGLSEEVVHEYADKLDEEGQYMLYLIKQNAEKMDTLLTELMAFARAKAADLEREHFNIETIFQENVDSQMHEYPHNTIQLEMETLPTAYGDKQAIDQVVQNLVGNALKYSSKNDSIRIQISGHETATEMIYQISDNGVGFDERQGEQLFTIFKRLHSNKEFKGTGVGLAMCQRIIKKHGGRIWAKSVIGQGSTFFFSLPKSKQTAVEQSAGPLDNTVTV